MISVSRIRITLSVLSFSLAALLPQAWAGGANGRFEGPSIDSYHELTPQEHEAYRQAEKRLYDPKYMEVRIAVTNDERYIGPSFYASEAGQKELREISAELLKLGMQHYGEIVFVGRSGTGIKAYLEGILDMAKERDTLKLKELPFSCSEPALLTSAQKLAFRAHLEANGLAPHQLANAKKPVLVMDFVYSGTGVNTLFKLIHDWAKEAGVDTAKVRANLGFYGAYPVRMLVVNNLMKINHASILEGEPIAITEERVTMEARGRRLPNEGAASRYAARVHERQISDKLYDYAGNLVKHPNRSFTPERWEEPLDRSESLKLAGGAHDMSNVELYHLMQLGRREAHSMMLQVDPTRARCEKTLR